MDTTDFIIFGAGLIIGVAAGALLMVHWLSRGPK